MDGKPAMFEEFETSRKLRTRDIEKAQVSCRKLHNFRIPVVPHKAVAEVSKIGNL